MCKVKLRITVRWQDEGFEFWRDAPELPPGVCWAIGMDFLHDELEFRVKRIFVYSDGDVEVISSDMLIDENVTKQDLEAIEKNGWKIAK